ncbi:MAG: 50S ribosomal protein L24 [Thermodesulfovibrionales bacterium]|nr:50S ribosomal protein L24 [Thermodesulfovibrionales bacterium]
MGLRIKKGDTALVITGKEKGKKGRVIRVNPSEERLIIEGLNITKKHMKPSRKYTQGGIIEKEGYIHLSNVMLLCPKCNKPTRIGNQYLTEDKKVRVCKKCKEVID